MMDGMHLLMLWCAAFICTCGDDQVSSCEVMITVRRGTRKCLSPGQSLTVECPVKHCGKLFNVTWCKFVNTRKCEIIPNMENIQIRQKYDKDELISYLSFTQVSINDDGLYRCDLDHSHESVSHAINISVSDLNKRVENPYNFAVDSNTPGHGDSWLPYFTICISMVLLVTTVIVLTLVCCHGWKRIWTSNNKKQEEISTHTIPELPKTSVSLSPTVQTQTSVPNDINSSSKAERTTSASPSLAHIGNRPAVANTAAKTQEHNSAVYAVINYRQCGTPDRRSACKHSENTNYAVINVH